MTDGKITFNGVEYTLEQIAKMRAELEAQKAVLKGMEKEGLIEKAKPEKKKPEELPSDVQELHGELNKVIEKYKATVERLFKETVTDKKPDGQIGVNCKLANGEFDVQLLSVIARKKRTPEKPPKEEKA